MGSGRRKWNACGTKRTVSFMCRRITVCISHSWLLSAPIRCPHALQAWKEDKNNSQLLSPKQLTAYSVWPLITAISNEVLSKSNHEEIGMSYTLRVSSIGTVTTQSMGRIVWMKWCFVLLCSTGAEERTGSVTSVIRLMFMMLLKQRDTFETASCVEEYI